MKATILIVITLLFGASISAPAQTKAWRTQSPCRSNFSVELPVPLYQVSWFEGKHGPTLEPDEGFNEGGASYAALQENPKRRQYGIVVQEVTGEARSKYRRGEFEGDYFIIGGDDATPTSEKFIRANGLNGREYVYAREVAADIYTRGRIFYAGNRLYVIVFVAATAEDLMSADATRFLDSFHIRMPEKASTRRPSTRHAPGR
jgi:hypothetical protein